MNLTQEALGQKCGLHLTFIGSVERGERNVALLSLRKIAGQRGGPPAPPLNQRRAICSQR